MKNLKLEYNLLSKKINALKLQNVTIKHNPPTYNLIHPL